jgi:nucleotide-binding universal stress UspA family protein
MKIIVATDFSPAASNAARSAVRLARKLGDSILLVRVVEPPVAVYPELRVPDTTTFEAALRARNQTSIEEASAALREEQVPVEGLVLTGSPAAELVQLAEDQKARFIVMGTRGHGALASLLYGSVAERTVLAAPCPVLLIPEKQPLFEGWSADRPLRLMVGLDLDTGGDAALATVEELRKAGACETTLIHTYWPPAEYARLGIAAPKDLFATDPEVAAVLEREIRDRLSLRGLPRQTTLRIQANWGPVHDTLTADAEEDAADILVVATRQPGRWERIKSGSSAVGTVRRAHTAVLCVPGRPTPAPARTAIPPLRTVLVTTDFSELGNAAIPYAYSLLRSGGGTVQLCHVHEHRRLTPAYVYPGQQQIKPEQRQQLEERLRTLIPPESQALGIFTQVEVVDGGPAAEGILQASERLGADALVLASHGRSGLARSLMGSVAEAVLRGCRKPVFVVRPPAR